jgi:triphosphatase
MSVGATNCHTSRFIGGTVMESELKLLVSTGKAAQVLHAPAISRLLKAPATTKELTSTCFDTPEFLLHKNGASLRVRAVGADRIQTLKLDGSTRAGLFERDEFESSIDNDRSDLKSLQQQVSGENKPPKLLRNKGLASALQPLFVTRVKRSTAILQMPHGAEVELAADDGVIETETGATSIQGIELELKRGAPTELYELALALLETVPVRIDYISKGDRGYALLVQEHRAAVRAEPLKLKHRLTVEEAFQKIVRNCLAQVHSNERGVVSGHDPSCVHQMRVGLRRLRSAFDLFEKVIPAPAEFATELRWIAGELGEARDWEVLVGNTLDKAFETVRDEDAGPTQRAAKDRAITNRQAAAMAVDSVRYTRLVLKLTLWVDSKGWRHDTSGRGADDFTKSITEFADSTLAKRHKMLLKRGRHLADLDDASRHRARIAAKKVRYATERPEQSKRIPMC